VGFAETGGLPVRAWRALRSCARREGWVRSSCRGAGRWTHVAAVATPSR